MQAAFQRKEGFTRPHYSRHHLPRGNNPLTCRRLLPPAPRARADRNKKLKKFANEVHLAAFLATMAADVEMKAAPTDEETPWGDNDAGVIC